MSEELKLLKLVCSRLNQAHIRYMLTGSLAANLYAVPRMTRDIDFVIEILEPDVDRFSHLFSPDFYIDQNSITDAIKQEGMFNIIHNESIFKADFIIRKYSAYREVEFERRREIEIDGLKLWVVSPEDLIISKLAWAKDSLSEMQIKDVRNLLLSIENLNEEYIRYWVDNLELKHIYERAKSYG